MCLPKMRDEEGNLMLFMLLVTSFFFLTTFSIVTLFFTYKKIRRLQELENYANALKGTFAAHSSDLSLFLETLPSKIAAKCEGLRLLGGKVLRGAQNSNGLGPIEDAKKPSGVEEEKEDKVVETRTGQEKGADDCGLAVSEVGSDAETADGSGSGQAAAAVVEEERVKKKKKKGKKKRTVLVLKGGEGEENGDGREGSELGLGIKELGCLCPPTSMGSATQRKIKDLYHQLVQSCESNELTLAKVGEFTKCLAQAKEDLEDKSEAIKRKFSIKKALLSKADRSSIDRLRQQIFNLEKQQKRLEEDVFVYNWLQEQLQLSPACKKMLEVCADMELTTKSSKQLEKTEKDEFANISFEELLAQEKKDSFWQKNWKSRMCSR